VLASYRVLGDQPVVLKTQELIVLTEQCGGRRANPDIEEKMLQQLGVAIVGGGFMGKAHSLAYAISPLASDLGVTVRKRLLVDTPVERAEALARQLGWDRYSGDWTDAVTRDDIDIVDICTPPQFHADIAIAAMGAGKHVFCEKPISNDASEAERMAKVAAHAGVITQVGFNYRHAPAIAFSRKLLDEGRLGRPLQFRGSYLQDGGFTADPHLWRAQRATGGSGAVGDIGSHIIDIAEYLVADITSVSARMRSMNADRDQWRPEPDRLSEDAIDDAGIWSAVFADGSLGSFAVSSFASGRKNLLSFQLDGTRGGIDFDWNHREEFRVSYTDEPADHRGFRTIYTNDQHPNGWWRLAGLGTGYVDVTAIQLQSFLRGVVEQKSNGPDFASAAHTQQVVDSIAAASSADAWVAVPPRILGSLAEGTVGG
jgi:predicted dehydrogenase